ncbi:Serine/threonine-protein kinase D3 [Mortierella alpina]|nr:Serine/threonine-protein kinase D3 [Mortierella alpina]
MEGVMIAALNHTGCDTTSLDRVSAHQQRAHDEKIAAAMKCAKDQRDTRVEPMRYPSEASLTPLPEAFAADHHTTSTTSPSPSSSSSSSSRHRSTSKHVEHRQGQQNRVMIPPQASDASEVPLEAFAEGEVLEMDHSDDHGAWDRHHSSDPFTAQQLRYARARCSSSTLFDDARPSSGQDGSWTYQPKKDSMDLLPGSPALAQHQQHPAHYRNTYDQLPKKQAIMFVDQATQQQGQPQQQPHHLLQQQHGFAYHRHGKRINDTVSSQAKTLTNGDSLSSTNSCGAESPSWAAGTRLKIEPSTPVRPASHGTHHSHDHSKGSSPLTAPTTPLTPTPAELDKPTKNLMIFNKIPRQWPASQETLHHNFVTKAIKKTPVIKEFDSATAERIDRVINKERPLNRAAKERLAAEQKEAELEARGFFDPARRWKGRDAYPRPDNWVYCRRTKNNWLEKTKILVDSYKLFKGQVLGKGHHADVYKGVDLTTGQELAIKVIYKTVTRRLGFVNEDPMQEVKNRRLLNEAWFIDYLKDGPGICKMLRVVETATKFYFVMELAQSDLNSYSNGINMREEEIRHILRPIFECLKYAHSHDITHRDIKPENILLRTKKDWLRHNSQSSTGSGSNSNSSANIGKNNKAAHGNNNNAHRGLRHIDDSSSMLSSTFANESSYMDMDTTDGRSSMDSSTLYNFDHRFDAFLADWGLAVEHDCNSGRKPVGTPLYAAPEVVRKMKRIRRREWINYRACDIWSLGVTMFVIASGIYPYHTHDALEAQSPPNWAALEASGMSREYIAFTQRLMNLTAELRPSATEACNDPWLQG